MEFLRGFLISYGLIYGDKSYWFNGFPEALRCFHRFLLRQECKTRKDQSSTGGDADIKCKII